MNNMLPLRSSTPNSACDTNNRKRKAEEELPHRVFSVQQGVEDQQRPFLEFSKRLSTSSPNAGTSTSSDSPISLNENMEIDAQQQAILAPFLYVVALFHICYSGQYTDIDLRQIRNHPSYGFALKFYEPFLEASIREQIHWLEGTDDTLLFELFEDRQKSSQERQLLMQVFSLANAGLFSHIKSQAERELLPMPHASPNLDQDSRSQQFLNLMIADLNMGIINKNLLEVMRVAASYPDLFEKLLGNNTAPFPEGKTLEGDCLPALVSRSKGWEYTLKVWETFVDIFIRLLAGLLEGGTSATAEIERLRPHLPKNMDLNLMTPAVRLQARTSAALFYKRYLLVILLKLFTEYINIYQESLSALSALQTPLLEPGGEPKRRKEQAELLKGLGNICDKRKADYMTKFGTGGSASRWGYWLVDVDAFVIEISNAICESLPGITEAEKDLALKTATLPFSSDFKRRKLKPPEALEERAKNLEMLSEIYGKRLGELKESLGANPGADAGKRIRQVEDFIRKLNRCRHHYQTLLSHVVLRFSDMM